MIEHSVSDSLSPFGLCTLQSQLPFLLSSLFKDIRGTGQINHFYVPSNGMITIPQFV